MLPLLAFTRNHLCWMRLEYSFNCIPAVESFADPRNLLSLALDGAVVLVLLWCCRNRAHSITSAVALTVVPFIPSANVFFRLGTSAIVSPFVT